MDDPSIRQWIPFQEVGKAAPEEPPAPIPSRQPFLPDARDLVSVPAQSPIVARYAVVGIVAPHHRTQMVVLVADGPVPVGPTPVGDRCQCTGVTVLCRYLPYRVSACPSLAPYVAKAKKGERGLVRFRIQLFESALRQRVAF